MPFERGPMRRILLVWTCCAALLPAAGAAAQGPAVQSPRATPKIEAKPPDTKLEAPSPEFLRFLETLWPKAQARGVSRATFDLAFQGVTPDPKVAVVGRAQSEFAQPISAYLDGAVSGGRIRRGGELARQWAATLDAVEAFYGVPRSVVLAAWGMESNFGGYTGKTSVIRALATLAFHRQRAGYFERELIAALEMIEKDHIRPAEMLGSWAGAMGQTQFMPSSFLAYAADGDGDGRRDIWASVPDVLASIANFLKEHGWKPGLPWGFEVALPEGFDFRNHRQSFSGWESLGLRRMDGKAMPRAGEATLFLPAGARGPALLVTANYLVIKTYNSSDAYALGVALLGDRIFGGQPLRGAWPKDEPALDMGQRQEVQRQLQKLGHDVGEPDGKIGSKTREAVRQFQLRRGLVPDGYADLTVLKELRAAR
jgi:membrane-bound lytic murein transglycosylase B